MNIHWLLKMKFIYIYGSVNGLAKNGCFEKKEFRSTPI